MTAKRAGCLVALAVFVGLPAAFVALEKLSPEFAAHMEEARQRARERDEVEPRESEHAAEQVKQARNERARALRDALMEKLDAYALVSISVQGTPGGGWRANITMSDRWHLKPMRLRKIDATKIWEQWALLAAPDKPDSARIRLLDSTGDEVGGSRALGGSLIWVED